MLLESKVICNREFQIGTIDTKLYGSFLEHMGRVIYTGIYEPEHAAADEEGFRKDVLGRVREMGVSAVRYPGGNFVSAYHWEDGVGPRAKRPRKLDLAWRAVETNEFGTDEFVHWADKAGVMPVFTVNLGTRGMEEALQYLEYCNFPEGTRYSELRKAHGAEHPYGVKLWCLGNEMDGQWQIGHKTAYEYGRLAAETGRAMKLLDPEIELIVCGSSLSTMESCPQWDQEVLEQTYDVADYIALHQYYGGQEKGTKAFLAQTADMEEYIKTLRAVVQVVKQKKRSKKDLKLSVDEWGVWAVPGNSVNQEIDGKPWQMAPAISEQIYTLEDALLFAGMMMVMLRNCDVVRLACQSLLTNVSACIMTEEKGDLWLQTIYYPFYYFANYAKGIVLDCRTEGPYYDCEEASQVPYLDEVLVWNPEQRELIAFLINKSETETMDVKICLQGFAAERMKEFMVFTAKDKKLTNQMDHHAVIPAQGTGVRLSEGAVQAALMPLSFNMIRIEVRE